MKCWCLIAQVSEFLRCVEDTCTRTTSSTAISSLDPTEGCERKKQNYAGMPKARKHHVQPGLDGRVISQDAEAHRLRHVSAPWTLVHLRSADLPLTSSEHCCASLAKAPQVKSGHRRHQRADGLSARRVLNALTVRLRCRGSFSRAQQAGVHCVGLGAECFGLSQQSSLPSFPGPLVLGSRSVDGTAVAAIRSLVCRCPRSRASASAAFV